MNSAAKQVLDYLMVRSGTGVIAGQFGAKGSGETTATSLKQLADIKALSGKEAGMTGMDYVMEEGRHAANLYLIDQWERGLIVTLSWHSPNPWTGGKSDDIGDPNDPDTNWRAKLGELVDPSTVAGATWAQMLAEIADSLVELRDAGVPVLWRPLHELNGGWFWWTPAPDASDKPQPAPFIALWKHMHHYFTNVRKLDNLLWVYSPNVCDKWRPKPNVFYPGAEFVDVVGLDKYRALGETPLKLNEFGEYDQLVATGKPVGLCEFGPIPSNGSGWNTEKFDWSTLVRDLHDRYPEIVFFSAWEGVWSIPHKPTIGQSAMMNDGWTITLDDLPEWDSVTPPPVDPPPTDPDIAALVEAAVARRMTVLETNVMNLIDAEVKEQLRAAAQRLIKLIVGVS